MATLIIKISSRNSTLPHLNEYYSPSRLKSEVNPTLKLQTIISMLTKHLSFQWHSISTNRRIINGITSCPFTGKLVCQPIGDRLTKQGKNLKIYCRCDIFCIFENKEQEHLFEKEINKMHKDMKFVIQTCQDGRLPFHNTQLAIKNNTIITSSYRKPSSTGVLMNYNSCVPQSWKRNLVKNLYYRNQHLVS